MFMTYGAHVLISDDDKQMHL